MEGLVFWFSVDFPGEDFTLTTSPYKETTHWEQGMILLPQTRVEQDSKIHGRLTFTPNPANHRDLQIKVEAFLDDQPLHTNTYSFTNDHVT